jgi:integrase
MRYVTKFVDRHGKLRWRFRRRGVSVYLPGAYGSDEFLIAYDAVMGEAREIGASRTKADTIGFLVAGYLASSDYKLLADNTRRTYRYHLERFRVANGSAPLRHFNPTSLAGKLDTMAGKPATANIFLKVMRALGKFGQDRKIIKWNPTEGIKRMRDRTDGIHTWTEDQLAQFEARHPVGSKANLAFRLMLYTAQRRSDVIRMGKQHERNGSLQMKQRKTGTKLVLPIMPELREAIDKSPTGDLNYLVTEFGKPFTDAGFGNWFRDRCDEAGLKGCSAHGLRKAAARRMAESGASASQIMAVTGHKSLSEVERYTRAASQERMAIQGAEGLKREPK